MHHLLMAILRRHIPFVIYLATFCAGYSPTLSAQTLDMTLRYQIPVQDVTTADEKEKPVVRDSIRYHRLTRQENWDAEQTALIICDMWDSHHSVNAVRRVAEIAPKIDRVAKRLRQLGGTVIHAPSSCMEYYKQHPARKRATAVPAAADFPEDIASWCNQIPSEERAAYPLDQSDGGEDDDPLEHQQWAERLSDLGLDPGVPWSHQTEAIEIDPKQDFISDSGQEIWSILTNRQISNVILLGVHTNMCVLGRPFGLRRLSQAGKNVVLCRDLTDTMYNPRSWPYASHFTGTDLIVSHIERFVCPTISSEQILGGSPHRFHGDRRIRLAMLIAEDEYETIRTLPEFAAKHLSQHFKVIPIYGSSEERNLVPGIEQVAQADALLVSVRRRALPVADLELIRQFVSQAKPVIGIRTASHAFSLRGKAPEAGHATWEGFDAQVFGGNYTNHYGNSLRPTLQVADEAHPIMSSLKSTLPNGLPQPGGSLYRTSPLQPGARALLTGAVEGKSSEPVAWTFIRADSGRSFYTSLGHREDFQTAEFQTLLSAGIHWACGLAIPNVDQVVEQEKRYTSGSGRQR